MYETDKTHLFIHLPMFGLYDEQDIKDFTEWAIKSQEDHFHRYNIVFIYQVTDLSICNLEDNRVITMRLEKNKVHRCCKHALEKA